MGLWNISGIDMNKVRIYYEGEDFTDYNGQHWKYDKTVEKYVNQDNTNDDPAIAITLPPDNGGFVKVFISPSALASDLILYLTIGHELIHVGQYLSLNIWKYKDEEKWTSKMEYYAYKWMKDVIEKNGWTCISTKKQIDNFVRTLPQDTRFKFVIP
jgi:hypothetical protein